MPAQPPLHRSGSMTRHEGGRRQSAKVWPFTGTDTSHGHRLEGCKILDTRCRKTQDTRSKIFHAKMPETPQFGVFTDTDMSRAHGFSGECERGILGLQIR